MDANEMFLLFAIHKNFHFNQNFKSKIKRLNSKIWVFFERKLHFYVSQSKIYPTKSELNMFRFNITHMCCGCVQN